MNFLEFTSEIVYFMDSYAKYDLKVYNLFHLMCFIHHSMYIRIIDKIIELCGNPDYFGKQRTNGIKEKVKSLYGKSGMIHFITFWLWTPFALNKWKFPSSLMTERKHEANLQLVKILKTLLRRQAPLKELGVFNTVS